MKEIRFSVGEHEYRLAEELARDLGFGSVDTLAHETFFIGSEWLRAAHRDKHAEEYPDGWAECEMEDDYEGEEELD
jgi:hypothetical protein